MLFGACVTSCNPQYFVYFNYLIIPKYLLMLPKSSITIPEIVHVVLNIDRVLSMITWYWPLCHLDANILLAILLRTTVSYWDKVLPGIANKYAICFGGFVLFSAPGFSTWWNSHSVILGFKESYNSHTVLLDKKGGIIHIQFPWLSNKL